MIYCIILYYIINTCRHSVTLMRHWSTGGNLHGMSRLQPETVVVTSKSIRIKICDPDLSRSLHNIYRQTQLYRDMLELKEKRHLSKREFGPDRSSLSMVQVVLAGPR